MRTERQLLLLAMLGEIRDFVPHDQYAMVAKSVGKSEEGACEYTDAIERLHGIITTMPVTYQQDGMGDDAVVYLHYFCGPFNWFITEKDKDGGVDQAYGLTDLRGEPELGYISIREICAPKLAACITLDSHILEVCRLQSVPYMNLDFHFATRTLREVKEKRQ